MEWNVVPAGKSFVLVRLAAPFGKKRSSPGTGAVPPQFVGFIHEPLFVPVHVAAEPTAAMRSNSEHRAKRTSPDCILTNDYHSSAIGWYVPSFANARRSPHTHRNRFTANTNDSAAQAARMVRPAAWPCSVAPSL